MALSTYAELKDSVANWADRHDLAPTIPDFIALAEARLNRELRLRAMETKEYAKTIGGQANYKLPSGFIQMREFRLNTIPTRSLQYITPEIYESWNFVGSGMPKFYTVIANEVRLGRVPDGEYEMEMLFYRTFENLSDSNPTNWVLENAPDILLYGSLLELEPFIQNDARIQVWASGYQNAVDKLQLQDEKDRHSGSALMVRR
jgi:hypothetical protein